MTHRDVAATQTVQCPQELVDLILDETDPADKETHKSCALVARSFREKSQRKIFSDLRILPQGRDSVPALNRLAEALSSSPQLALYVRTLYLVQPSLYEPCAWMQVPILPDILSVLTRLTSLRIRVYNWDYFNLVCENAIYALIVQSSLLSIVVEEPRFSAETQIISLLRCLPTTLESVSFITVFDGANSYAAFDVEVPTECLQLTSLHIESESSLLFVWLNGTVHTKSLRNLRIKPPIVNYLPTTDLISQMLEEAVAVEVYHLVHPSIFRYEGLETHSLARMKHLRTLEFSVELDYEELTDSGHDERDNALLDVLCILDTAPSSVEHLILNLKIYNPQELHMTLDSGLLERFGKDLPALQDVVVRMVSRFPEQSLRDAGVRHLRELFSSLNRREILTVVDAWPPERED
ncbi:hypothetical protein R3P38DRAFT_1351979 [Favolaschia claudopus]|uniref:F-box domain-containing protein n=1 Tax=Favolaschia claudopus TaxID=2862362 RepID=A0AAW0DR06_9AGAR